MAITTTTLSGAISRDDISIPVAAVAGFAPGYFAMVDGEMLQVTGAAVGLTVPVKRGMDGTLNQAHPTGAPVNVGLASDFAPVTPGKDVAHGPGAGVLTTSYSAAGAITNFPGLHILNGTTILAMTLAAPGQSVAAYSRMQIVSSGKAAHTVTIAGGAGGGGTASDVATFAAAQQGSITLIAVNGVWVVEAVGSGVTLA